MNPQSRGHLAGVENLKHSFVPGGSLIKRWFVGSLVALSMVASLAGPALAADEHLQMQLIKQLIRFPQNEWAKMLDESRQLLDASFFERCDSRIRWGIDNNQIEDAIRFSMISDAAMRANGQNGKYRMSLVYAFLKSGNDSMADQILANIMLTDPSDQEAQFLSTGILRARNQFYDAYVGYKKLSEAGYRADECLYQMGVISAILDQGDRAEKEFQQALTINPNNAGAKAALDKLVASRPKFIPGGGGFKDVPIIGAGAQVSPDAVKLATSLFNQAEAHSLTGQLTKARDEYSKAIKTNPRLTKAYVYLGAVLYRLNDLDGALQILNQAVQADAKDREAWRFLAYCYERKFDTKGSPDDLERAILSYQNGSKNSPDDRQFQVELGRAQSKRKTKS
jgi:tetratricopeptide (TPR) repeat protein